MAVERTLSIIKPDATERNVTGKINQRFEDAGLRFSGYAGNRMEVLELPDHPYFVGTQFHPEFRSRPTRASPPFVGLLEAALELQRSGRSDAEGVEL